MVFRPKASAKETVHLSRFDVNEPLSSYSKHGFELDGQAWASVEHYYQASKFPSGAHRDNIIAAEHPKQATKLGEAWFKKKLAGWKRKQKIMMTRAVYTKCRSHPEIAKALLNTGDKQLVDVSQFDYFWGIGRDGRGENAYGEVLMAVRSKLMQEQTT